MNEFTEWVGREEELIDSIDLFRANGLLATLDMEQNLRQDDPVLPGWQWLYFNSIVRRSGLGRDGHPEKGGFLPPIMKPRRMWAGSRIKYLKPLLVGVQAYKISKIVNVVKKSGRSGEMWFVTIEHTIGYENEVCIVEEQDLVYRDAPDLSTRAAAVKVNQPVAEEIAVDPYAKRFDTDTTLLFRYSALTFNGHRIHYDQAYATHEEGYKDLVVHGPLTATVLQLYVSENYPDRILSSFSFRGVAPLFVGDPIHISHGVDADSGSLNIMAKNKSGHLAMSATATFK